MLTNEEALRLIKQCDECFVVWDTDRNAVVAVHPLPRDATGDDRLQVMESFGTNYEGPTMGRFFRSDKVTLQTLQDTQADNNRLARRLEIFNSWNRVTIDDLIDVVIERRFYDPMDEFHGSQYIIERLYKIYSPWLTESQLSRLERFAYSAAAAREQRSAQRDLQCYLAVLQNNPDRLKAFWKRHRHDIRSPMDRGSDYVFRVDWPPLPAFIDAAGDLPTSDRGIIAQLIEVVQSDTWGQRYDAMVALGKIGQPSGDDSTESEYESPLCNRCVARIQEAEGYWTRCDRCNRGYVDGVSSFDIPAVERCEECLGLGYIPTW